MTETNYLPHAVPRGCWTCGSTRFVSARATRWQCQRCGVIHDTHGPRTIESTSDQRAENNVLRHEYRALSDAEKAQVKALKDKGAEFLALIVELSRARGSIDGVRLAETDELRAARQRMEEAVMWAVKHVTR